MMWILINTPGPTGVEGAGGSGGPGCGARGRWRCLVAVPVGGGRARAGLEIDHSEPSGSRVAISRAGRRPPAHTAARPNQVDHAQWTAGGPPPTGTHSGQTEPGRSCAVDGGWAAAHGHTKWPGLTRQKIPQPEVWQLVQRLNSAQDAQQLEPQQINEKRPPSHQHSQLHSNTPKSHMRNMRAS